MKGVVMSLALAADGVVPVLASFGVKAAGAVFSMNGEHLTGLLVVR